MFIKLLGKKHVQLILQVVAALAVLYVIIHLVHSLNCSCDKDKTIADVDPNSIPARLKIGAPDSNGRVQFMASFDSKDLLKIWNDRERKQEEVISKNPSGQSLLVEILLHNKNLCNNDNDVEWILYVITSPENEEKRQLLRESWADPTLFRKNIMKVIFVVGLTSDSSLQDKLIEESKTYNDIVQGDFEDTSKSKALKALLGMKWISEYCSRAKYALKANDDSFINIFGIMSLTKSNLPTNRTILCSLWAENTMPILRDPQKCGSWCVKDDDFPGRTHFPQYCAGIGYVTSIPLVKEMYQASLIAKYFWIEDVFITGVLPAHLSKPIDFINIQSSFSLNEDDVKKQYLNDKSEIDIYLSHISDTAVYKKLWKALINRLPPNWFSQLSDSAIARNA